MEELLYENHGQKFLIRPMRTVGQEGRDEVASVLSLWAKIGLHEGTETIQSFASIDPKGFLVTVLLNKDQGTSSKDGEIIGCVAGVQIDPTLGHFLGLYAIHPDFQGRGLGVKMWNFLMDKHVQSKMHEKDIEDKTDIKDRNGPNAGLYAVPEHLHTYRDRAGFKIQDMDRNMVVHMSRGGLINTDKLVQKMGNVDVWNILTGQKIPALVDGKKIKDGNTTTSTTNDSGHESDLESRVIVYDKLCTGISHENRSRLLSKCFREGETLSYAAINKFDKQVVGYICIRSNNVGGCMIGPLYANDDAVAELLANQAIQNFDQEKIAKGGLIFFPFDSHPGSIFLAQKLDLDPKESIPRFFTKFVPKTADFRKIYCIHTPNFFHY